MSGIWLVLGHLKLTNLLAAKSCHPPLFRQYGCKQFAFIDVERRYNGLVEWTMISEAALDLTQHGFIGKVEVFEFAEITDCYSRPFLVDFPDQFGAIHIVVRPFKVC